VAVLVVILAGGGGYGQAAAMAPLQAELQGKRMERRQRE
jgi:hypothetical protein